MAHPSGSANAREREDIRSPRLLKPAIIASSLLAVQLAYLFSGIDRELESHLPGSRRKPVALLERSMRDVKHKSAGSLVWRAGASGELLIDQDTIATMTGSEARVKFLDGTEILVEEGSLIVLEAPAAAETDDAPSPVSARLLRGSIKRVKAGKSPIALKFSTDPLAPELLLEDTDQASIFRVVVARAGIRVIVESGTLRAAWNRGPAKTLDAAAGMRLPAAAGAVNPPATPRSRLRAPRLKKPEVEIQPVEPRTLPSPGARLWRRLRDELFAQAWAAPPGHEISIVFAWEEIPGAREYDVQIASDEGFRAVLLAQRTKLPRYAYLTAPPPVDTTLYFRVAGVDETGVVGDFSATGKVEIKSDPATALARDKDPPAQRPAPTPAPADALTRALIEAALIRPPAPSPASAKPVLAKSPDPAKAAAAKPLGPQQKPAPEAPLPAAAKDEPQRAPIVIAQSRYVAEARLGLAYHSRALKHSAGLPKEANGGGLIPFTLRAHLEAVSGDPAAWVVGTGFEYFQEKATAESPAFGRTSAGVPSIRFRIGLSKRIGPEARHLAGVGPYLASTHRLSFKDSKLDSQLHWLAGAEASLRPSPEIELPFQWEARAALLALGTFGIDLSASLRKDLFANGPRSRLSAPSWFAGGTIQLRASGAENATAIIAEVGHGL